MIKPQNTLALLKHLAAGHRVLDIEIHGGKVFILFEDREIPAPGFRLGEPCLPFAHFAVKAGLNRDLGETLIYLAGLPTDLEGPIVWPDEIDWPE